MRRLSPIPLLVPVAVLCVGVMLAEGWGLQRARGEAVGELRTLERLKQERNWLAHQAPALTAENEAALAAEVAATGQVRDEFRQALAGDDPGAPAAPPPADSTEAFFALADFIRQHRARATQAQVVLKADECFGFVSYAHAGPVAEQVATVHRQRLATEYLVGRLLESRPQALLAVRRERPAANRTGDQRDRADDFFELDAPLAVRRPDEVAGEACQLEFTGQTAVLRNFLNALAAGRVPVVVRSVQVEPLATPVAPSPSGALAPLVGPVVSKFTVSVEIVRLADNPGTTLGLPEPAGVGWAAPPPQSKGGGWLYEVFTPPVIFHDAAAGSYAVTPPAQVAEPVGGATGLELLAVRPQPYRLQLLGYFGEPGDYLAVFVSPFSSETLLARPGRRFDGLGLALKSFDVRKVVIEGGELGPTYEVAAFAVLQDEATGTEVVLDSRTRKFTDALRVVLKVPGPAAPDVAHNEQTFSSP